MTDADIDRMIEEATKAVESMPGFSSEQRHWNVAVDNQAKTITYTPTEEYRRGRIEAGGKEPCGSVTTFAEEGYAGMLFIDGRWVIDEDADHHIPGETHTSTPMGVDGVER